jgi:hypothetical protein
MLPARDVAAGPRLFPAIGVEDVKARGPDQESAARLLTFVDRRFTLTQRVLGWNLDPETKLGRVLLLRRQAFEAERSGAFRKADFLWVEAHRALKHAAADAEVWSHALAISNFSPSITPKILCARFVQELFIDLHRAVFESLFAAAVTPPPGHRLFVHCTYVERLVDLAAFDAAKASPILRPMFDKWLGACRETASWKQGIAICTRLADRFTPSGTYIDELVVCLLRQTIDRLTKPPGPFDGGDARRLSAAIRSIERVVERDGPTGLGMGALARLHQMRAIALANTGARAEALVEIATALDHDANDPQFHETLRQLTYSMEEARAKASELRGRADPPLGPHDELLVAEALKGFGPMRLYRASAHSARTLEIAGAVAAIDLWRHIGLPRPAQDWPRRASALARALAGLAKNAPAGAFAVAASWSALSSGDEILASLPPEPIEAFLVRRLFEPANADRRVRSLRNARACGREHTTQTLRRPVPVS